MTELRAGASRAPATGDGRHHVDPGPHSRLNRTVGARRAALVVRRNVLVFRRARLAFWAGMADQLIYLASFGVLLDRLIGTVRVGGTEVDYLTFAGPGLLAGMIITVIGNEAVGNLFNKLRVSRAYEALMATPISGADVMFGEVAWTTVRAALYAVPLVTALVAAGAVKLGAGPWVLVGVVVGACGLSPLGVAAGTMLRNWQHRDLIQAVTLPLFFLSGTLFPVDIYPRAVRVVVEILPVYQCAQLLRALQSGTLDGRVLAAVAYFGVLGALGGILAARRLESVFRS